VESRTNIQNLPMAVVPIHKMCYLYTIKS